MGSTDRSGGLLADGELVAAVRCGEPAALGLLLERNRAGMRAVAVSLLGWGPDADDAVQDAMLTAMRRIGDLRDPDAAGPWLKAITRNLCRDRLRRRSPEISTPDFDLVAGTVDGPERAIEQHALSDWVWEALETLSEPLQTVVMLRYFTRMSSYEQIAAACDVPVGTVRSRLSEARRKLTERLRACPAHDAGDVGELTERRRRAAEDMLAAAARGEFSRALAQLATPEMRMIGPKGQRDQGHGLIVRMMESDLTDGVGHRLDTVTAGRRTTILECDLISPPWDPEHCPPGVMWLIRYAGDTIERIRLIHPEPARS